MDRREGSPPAYGIAHGIYSIGMANHPIGLNFSLLPQRPSAGG